MNPTLTIAAIALLALAGATPTAQADTCLNTATFSVTAIDADEPICVKYDVEPVNYREFVNDVTNPDCDGSTRDPALCAVEDPEVPTPPSDLPSVGGCGSTLVYACAGWDASCHSWAGGNCAATAKGFHGGPGAGTGNLAGDDPGSPCSWVGTGCSTSGSGVHVGPGFGRPCVTAIATSASALGGAFDAAQFCAPV